jgi:hypothetical protein
MKQNTILAKDTKQNSKAWALLQNIKEICPAFPFRENLTFHFTGI